MGVISPAAERFHKNSSDGFVPRHEPTNSFTHLLFTRNIGRLVIVQMGSE